MSSANPLIFDSNTAALSEPPLLSHTPIIGHVLEMARDPQQVFVRGYRELGPVFRIKVLNRTMYAIAGPEAFEFVAQGGEKNLSAGPLLGATVLEIGAQRSLVTVEGAEHAHMRKSQRAVYSRSAFMSGAPVALARTQLRLEKWKTGDQLDMFSTFQRLTMEQLGLALINEEANDYFDDVRIYIGTVLNVYVHGLSPKWVLKLPQFLRAKQRFLEIGKQILEKRRASDKAQRDLIDVTLSYKDDDGNAFTELEMLMSIMSPFVAGMDTVAAMSSFLLYDLLAHPDILRQVLTEIDQHLDVSNFSAEMFMKMPTLHAAAIETMRMHTIAVAQPREAINAFSVNGFSIPKGAQVMVSGSVSHFLDRFYADPYRYTPDRHHAPRQEFRQKHAYAPYGIGARLCLGAGIAEVQFPLNVAMWLKRFEVMLDPPSYRLKIANNPTPHPSNFKIKITAVR
ncbi:MAG: cytochrome P450 [Anaerolineae bacterium]|nr:cytochrome P450 [Anaerolineae bacterium]